MGESRLGDMARQVRVGVGTLWELAGKVGQG